MPTPLPPFRPRLIGLDLDGTVLDGRGEMPDYMLRALQRCRAAGIELAFLTGRRPVTAKLGLSTYLDRAYVCTNSGCLLWDYPDWQQVCEPRLFPRELLAEVIETLAPYSLNLYHNPASGEAGRVLFRRQSTPEIERGQQLYGMGNPEITTLAELDSVHGITQLALPCSPELAVELQSRIRGRFGDRLLALAVRWPLVPCLALELFNPEANKGSALAQIAQRLDIPQPEVMAVGDDTNDLAMLHWAGWGVAMPHSEGEVRIAADLVLEGTDSQVALAQYLRRIAMQ